MSPMRERLEAIIEQAIDLLDQIDGDSDLEDDGSLEPALAPGMVIDAAGRWYWSCEDMEGCANENAA